MRLTPPKQVVFWISLILAVLALLGTLVSIPTISAIAFWLALAGYVLLAAGNVLTGF